LFFSFGYSLATADINGDGFQDLFVGAPFFHLFGDELTEFGGGAVYLYLNGPEGLSSQPGVNFINILRAAFLCSLVLNLSLDGGTLSGK